MKNNFGLTMTVLIDSSGELSRLGLPPNHIHMVVGEGGRVEYREQYNDNSFEAVIDQLLGR